MLSKGNFSGHFRYFFMGTDNETGLTDYYANALGAGLKQQGSIIFKLATVTF
jgi:hypothetical protein